ncbi:MAG TPA: DUF1697 domain-containing protein [Solirubrobacterales bacterium]|nr:DUF1697 domain-containing protein [Solirubrobacterales bacterium]
MDRYVAFLRGMNLGRRRIKNEELRAHFEAMGFEEVSTFRASGNVIFAPSKHEAEGRLASRLETELDERLGYDVPVFLRSDEEMAAKKKALALAGDEDLLAIEGRELYWLPSGGLLESDLDLKAIEKLLGTDTRRTMGTIEQIARLTAAE